MTKLGRVRQGAPIESDEAIQELLKSWPVPDVKDENRNLEGRSTVFGTPLQELFDKADKELAEQEEALAPEPELSVPSVSLEELEQIRQDAFEEGIKQGHEQGYEAGFKEGQEAGFEEGKQQGLEVGKNEGLEQAQPLIDEKLKLWQSLIDNLQQPLRQLDDQAEQQLVQLSVGLAKAVVRTEVTTNPQVILATLKACISALPIAQQQLKVYLHPEDLDIVEASYGPPVIDEKGWLLEADPTLHSGGCIVETDSSSIDFTLQNRINETFDSFLNRAGVDNDLNSSPQQTEPDGSVPSEPDGGS